MASSSILFVLFTATCIVPGEPQDSFVKVQCSENNVGVVGRPSLLRCGVHLTEEGKGATIVTVFWGKIGDSEPLISFRDDDLQQAPGFKFAEPSWSKTNMNVSLLITNTAAASDGDYLCTVFTDRGDGETKTRLQVKATYSAPTIQLIPQKESPKEDGMLLCQSRGGYPQGALRWFDVDNVDWSNSATMEVEEMDGGLFQLTSKLPGAQRSTHSRLTCAVFNANEDRENETLFEMPPTFNELEDKKPEEKLGATSHILAPVLVVGSLIVGLLIVLILKRRRQNSRLEAPRRESDLEEGVHFKDKRCPDGTA